jgi:NAD(P)-dependent dehydrogenase (short-subunit alcohol dehydrogenase family)
MDSVRGQTVVVIGASSGIGLAVARRAAQAGAAVTMVSRSCEKLQAAASSITGDVSVVAADMLDERAVGEALAALPHIDHLVLTAVADENKRRGPIVELTADQMERSLDKLRGFFFSVRAAAPRMATRGSITMTSGASALKPPHTGMSVLAAGNASVIAFGHALALELAPVRVNTITPGVVDTSVWSAEDRASIKKWAESAELPAQRFGQPEDIASAAIFLMTNPYVTGHNLVVDGGLVAT